MLSASAFRSATLIIPDITKTSSNNYLIILLKGRVLTKVKRAQRPKLHFCFFRPPSWKMETMRLENTDWRCPFFCGTQSSCKSQAASLTKKITLFQKFTFDSFMNYFDWSKLITIVYACLAQARNVAFWRRKWHHMKEFLTVKRNSIPGRDSQIKGVGML